MKQILTIIMLALIASQVTAQKSVTFVVDESLSPVEKNNMERFQESGSKAAKSIFHDEGVPGDTHAMIAWSFSDDEKFYIFTGKDVFFKTIVQAYAEHRPLVLSPDMIWVLISQGFARYVNAHSEEMGDRLVSHTGKMDLVVQSDKDLLSEDADWEKMMGDFTAQINENTKGDIAKTITADFSTTGTTERITSQITLMETMKSYFDYVVHYIACGIPSITLTGSPQDWQKVLEKTRQLEKYGIGKWPKSLVPILTEFVKASEGKPNQAFWKKMVKKGRLDKFAGGGCDLRQPTELDGWILKFFPDENGLTPDQVPHTHKMPSERVYVDFKYQVINPVDGTVIIDTPLQLVAGFIGTEVDPLTHALKPKMGWVVRQMESNDSIAKRLEKMDSESSFFGIELRVNKVPEHLSLLPHIKRVTLRFTDKVELPEWFYHLQIDKLTIEGEMSDEQEAAIWEHFPKADVRKTKKTKDIRRVRKASDLPIPKREINVSEYEALGIENDNEGVSNENNPRRNLHLSDEELTMVTPVNDLGFNMLRKVGSKESILLSPLGMTYALGLINNGASGKTRTQINKVLGCDDSKAANINDFCRKMLTESSKLDKLTKLDITNEFFLHKTYKPKSAFKEVAIDYYDTKFKESESGPSQGFALVNTIYFKGIWTDKFRKANTRDEVFKGENGKEKTMPMMNQTRNFFYTEDDLCQALCLPYSNGAYQMMVLLPKEGKTVGDVVRSLTSDSWEKMHDQMRRVQVEVKLPRFKSSSEVVLTDVMKTLGMPDAFSMAKADFSNLFDIKSWIAKVKQTGRIEVDETGTEATVVTALQGRIAGLDLVQPDIVRFHATHPFLYFIREWTTGTIFFIGQYMGT